MHGWPERLPGSIVIRGVMLREYHRARRRPYFAAAGLFFDGSPVGGGA